jgi:5'-nucleotidase
MTIDKWGDFRVRRTILIDQDGPLADWESEFLRRWKCQYPELPCVELDNRRKFRAVQDYEDLGKTPEEKALMRSRAESIYHERGFYENLPVVDGAVAALNEMLQQGHDVKICTSPLSVFRNCVLEKYEWIQKYFGTEFTERTILCKDKTTVLGDLLIDDNPDLCQISRRPPVWAQILFDAPYNRDVNDRARIRFWEEWPAVICA